MQETRGIKLENIEIKREGDESLSWEKWAKRWGRKKEKKGEKKRKKSKLKGKKKTDF